MDRWTEDGNKCHKPTILLSMYEQLEAHGDRRLVRTRQRVVAMGEVRGGGTSTIHSSE